MAAENWDKYPGDSRKNNLSSQGSGRDSTRSPCHRQALLSPFENHRLSANGCCPIPLFFPGALVAKRFEAAMAMKRRVLGER